MSQNIHQKNYNQDIKWVVNTKHAKKLIRFNNQRNIYIYILDGVWSSMEFKIMNENFWHIYTKSTLRTCEFKHFATITTIWEIFFLKQTKIPEGILLEYLTVVGRTSTGFGQQFPIFSLFFNFSCNIFGRSSCVVATK